MQLKKQCPLSCVTECTKTLLNGTVKLLDETFTGVILGASFGFGCAVGKDRALECKCTIVGI